MTNNRDLSDRRAVAVRRYLVEKGVARDRLVSKGYGESNPVVNEENELHVSKPKS